MGVIGVTCLAEATWARQVQGLAMTKLSSLSLFLDGTHRVIQEMS